MAMKIIAGNGFGLDAEWILTQNLAGVSRF